MFLKLNEKCYLNIFSSLPDTLDKDILELSKNVSNFIFHGAGIPTKENILVGLVQLLGDINFNAIGSVTARKIAEKVRCHLQKTHNLPWHTFYG